MTRNRSSGNPTGKPLRAVVDRRIIALADDEDRAADEADALARQMAPGSIAERMQRDEATRHRQLAARLRAEVKR